MRYIKNFGLAGLLLISFILSACNFGQEPEPTPDIGAIFTAAAETVQAQFAIELTQTALAAPTATQPPLPPTATPIPTFAIDGSSNVAATPIATFGIGTQPTGVSLLPTSTSLAVLSTQAGPVCMDSAFVADITYPDGKVVEDNVFIAKVWSIQNTGTCTWDDGFSLQPITGDAKGTWLIDQTKEFVKPGEIVEIRIDIRTPSKAGDWGGCWRMQGDSGQWFGTPLCLLVNVQ
jgi:Ig-like domain from next to BRCA1 gene